MEKSDFKKSIKQPFSWEPNTILFDSGLSMKAKGLWLYMNGKPDGWNFAAKRIAEECSDGIDSIRSGLKELVKAGYLIYKKQGNGRALYELVSEHVENHVEKTVDKTHPKPENPIQGKSQNGKIQSINNKENDKERQKEKEAGGPSAPTGLAGKEPAGRLNIKRGNYKSEKDYEKAFYDRNTVTVEEIMQ